MPGLASAFSLASRGCELNGGGGSKCKRHSNLQRQSVHVFSLSLRCFRSFLTLVSVFAFVSLVNGERF